MPKTKKIAVFPTGAAGIAATLYLLLFFCAGFITNFFSLGTVNTGTILLYLLALFLSIVGVANLFRRLNQYVAKAAWIMIAISFFILFKAIFDDNPISQRITESTIFFCGAWPFLFFIQINSSDIQQQLLKVFAWGLFCLCIFALFQSVFAASLPLELFVLRGDPTFGVTGSDALRPTGLTGNPIIFSGILVFASAYFAALWLEKHRSIFLWALICSLIANYLTYTRASIVLVIPVLLFVWLFHKRFRIKHKSAILFAVVLIAVSVPYFLAKGADLIIIQRLQNSDPGTIGSTLEHFRQVQNAADTIAAHPLVGAGLGSQGDSVGPENVIITDGLWWILLLEFGVPLTFLIVILLAAIIIPIFKFVLRQDSKNRAIAIATLAFHVYIIPSSFINSALLGHISYGLYWVALGLSLASITGSPAPRTRRTPNLPHLPLLPDTEA